MRASSRAAAVNSSTPTVMACSSTSKSPWCRSRTVRSPGRADAQAGHGAGDVLQVPGEVLAAEALLGVLDGLRAAAGGHRVAQQLGDTGVVDDRRDAPDVVDLRLGAVQMATSSIAAWIEVGGLPPGVEVQAADRAGELGVLRDDVAGVAGLDAAPGHGEAGAGVDAAGDAARARRWRPGRRR